MDERNRSQVRRFGTFHGHSSGELSNIQATYLSAADPEFGSWRTRKEFNESLLMNALFQPAILVPDIWFYRSPHLVSHLLRSPHDQSLIEALMREGILIPSFREPTSIHYNESAFLHTAETARNQINNPFDENIKKIESKLMRSFYGDNLKWHVWPDISVGEQFENLLRAQFSSETPPHLAALDQLVNRTRHDELIDFWNISRKWRSEVVDMAKEITMNSNNSGITRMALFEALNLELGGDRYRRMLSIRDLPRLHGRQSRALKYYLQWMIEIYQLNQARTFRAVPNFTTYEPIGGLAAWVAAAEQSEGNGGLTDVGIVSHEVMLPSEDVLLAISPAELVLARQTHGVDYFAALSEFLSDPTEQTRNRVKFEMDRYATRITEVATRNRGQLELCLLDLHVSPAKTVASMLSSIVTGAVAAVPSLVTPSAAKGSVIELIVAGAVGGAFVGAGAVYWEVSYRLRSKNVRRHKVSVRDLPELNVPQRSPTVDD